MNTKKRKILSFFLSLLMAFSMVPFGELAGIDLTVQAEAAGVPGYNATAAVQWAKDHVYDVTSKLLGRGYWEAGTGDCANFVSQCIFMGGIDPVTDWMTNGYYAHFPVGSEGAWIRAPELYDFVTSIGGKSIKNPSASEVEPGDLIFYKKSGSSDMDHSAIVVEVSGNTVKIAAHTTLEKCYIADWRLDGFSPSGTYLVKMYGATCTEQVVRDVEVYTAPGNVDCKASPSSSAKKLFHTYKGEYYHVLEKKTVGGQTWGYTYGYGNDKIQWGWIPLSSMTYKGHYTTGPIDHLMGDWHQVVAPTCTTVGVEERECSRCGYTETRNMSIGGKHKNVVAATCLNPSYCTACGEILSDPLGHAMGDWIYITEPTCLTGGSRKCICERCGYTETEDVPALGHDFVANVTIPTCTTDGQSYYQCSRCDYSYIEDSEWSAYAAIDTSDPQYAEFLNNPELSRSRTEYRYRTKSTKTSTASSMSGWTLFDTVVTYGSWGSWSSWQDSKITETDTRDVGTRTVTTYKYWHNSITKKNGTVVTVPVSLAVYNEVANALGNSPGVSLKKHSITLTSKLTSTYVWGDIDGNEYTMYNGYKCCNTLDSSEDHWVYDGTGSKTQYRSRTRTKTTTYYYYKWSAWSNWDTTAQTASDTKEVEKRTTYSFKLAALGHDWDEGVTIAPTCYEQGYTRYTCQRCGITMDTDLVAPLGHDMHDDWYLISDDGTTKTYRRDCHRNCGYYEVQSESCVYTAEETVAPTCTSEGYTLYRCTLHPDETYQADIVPALGHQADENWVVTKAPTCTEAGEEVCHCVRFDDGVTCSQTYTREIAPVGYNLVKTEATERTCEQDGNIAYYTCQACNAVFADAEATTELTENEWILPATGHQGSTWVTEIAGACGVAQIERLYCENSWCDVTDNCGYENGHDSHHYLIEERTTPAEDHHFVLTGHRDPTCIELGEDTYTCDKCGETTSQYLTLTGHTWGEDIIYPQTCTEGGYTEKVCSYCGYTTYENATDATGHALSPNDEGYLESSDQMKLISSVPNVCGSGSVDTYQCTHINNGERCDYTVVIGTPSEHTLGEYIVSKDPTCTEIGLQHKECQNEGCTYRTADEPIAPLNHAPGESYIIKGSCTEDGAQMLDCTRCGLNLENTAIDARGHQWGKWETIQETSCTEEGLQQRVCLNTTETEEYLACDAVETRPLSAIGHDWGEWETVTPATCEGEGIEQRICKNDPSHVEENTLPAIGHAWDEGVIDPSSTCNTHGTKTYTCQNDPAHTYTEEVPLNPDNHVGDTYVKDAKAPTCTEEGYTGDTYCADCDALLTKGEAIPATGHNWGEWKTVTPATCEGEGIEQRICKNNPSHVEENTLPAIGHDWDEGVIDPSSTCNTHGTKTYTCKNDPSHTYTEEVPLNPDNHVGDTYVKDAKAPTCTEEGYTGDTYCADCDALLTKGEAIPATGHNWGEWKTVTPATCEGEGIEQRICKNDPSHVEENTLPAIGHDYHLSEEKSLAPDYGVGGYDYYECANDPAHYYTVSIPALVKATYTVTFVAEGEVVAVVTYEEGDKFVKEPTAPEKDNYTVEWEEYELNDTNITVNAIYTPIDPDNVSEIETDKTVDAFENGVATITLSAAAATRVIKLESVSTKPVDVILVLDLSGSMDESLGRRGDTKLEALQDCATSFIESLNANAVATGADHRVALVSFASADKRYNVSRWENTGLLVTGESGFVRYPNAAGYYDAAFMPTGDAFGVNRTLINAINNTKANGATCTHLGLLMAKNILAQTGADGREKVVVLITDGNPTIGGTVESEIAAAAPPAITYANDIKNMGVKLYTVGVEANADADQPFTSAEDGITGSGSRVSFDFNRFLHLVSSNYPDAEAMNHYGEKVNDGYYMPVNDTAALNDIFTKILVSSVYQKLVFTRCTLVDTLSADFVLTMEQETALRENLIDIYNLTNEDISIQRNEDGTTTLRIENVPAVKTEMDGRTVYRAAVTFDCSLAATEKGSYETNTDKAWVEVGGEKVENFEKPEAVTVESNRNIVVFTIGGEIYRIEEGKLGDTVVAPVTDLAQWSIPEGTVIEGSYAVFEAQSLSQERHTITWFLGDETFTETYRFGEKITPPAVADQGELVFSGFSPAVPHIMPNYDMTFTALFAPRHEHFFKQTGFYGTCTEGLTIVSTCTCGETREEKQAPTNHQFKAIIGTVDSNKLTDTLVCDFCGASEGHTLSFQTVTTAGRRTTIADLNLEKNGVLIQPAEGSSVKIMVPWSGRSSRVSVKRVNEQGVVQTYDTSIENGYLVFYADHFSIYVLEELDENGNAYESVSYTSALCTLAGAHQYEQSETAPTCTTDGSRTYTCTVCGDTYSETIPMTGHTDQDGDKVCDTCGAILDGHPDLCVYCGKLHTGFFGWIVKFFHYILWIFQLVFA